MKILFMGTPQFALPSLRALAGSGQEVAAVVTRADKPRGRRLLVSPSPVKALAGELGLAVLQPARLADPPFMEAAAELRPDLVAVVAYGAFLPRALRELAPRGAVNLHPSLLPRHRGAAPIPRSILAGDRETGVTIMYLNDTLDSGDIIAQEKAPILPSDTAESLGARLAEQGARLLTSAIGEIEKGTARAVPQDEALATYAPRLGKEEGLIDWGMAAAEIERRVRAFYPWPGAYTRLSARGKQQRLRIIDAAAGEGLGAGAGVIARCDDEGMHVAAGEGSLRIRRLQPEGKRVMTAAEFLAGRRGLEGMKLG